MKLEGGRKGRGDGQGETGAGARVESGQRGEGEMSLGWKGRGTEGSHRA